MGLPRLNTVEYFETLPISKMEVKYRPFNVGEQKVLLQALEEGEAKAISNALLSLIRVCTEFEDSRTKIEQLSNTDLEWLFIKIRQKSVGETTKILLGCIDQPNCDGKTTLDIDFNEMKIEGEVKDGKVHLTDNVGVVLKVPSFTDVNKISGNFDSDFSTTDTIFKLLGRCITQIFDADNVYDTAEFTATEIDDFIEDLSVDQFNTLMGWFESVPKLIYNAEFQCEKCGLEQAQELQGLQNFFV
tara:strand:+ start:566 stop:1297 length:732 start_codon:yes stop_codon:yes gene_type:complete